MARWIVLEIMPSEGIARSWLKPRVHAFEDVEDIIQEAYARMAGLTAFEQIERPRAFFLQTVRNLRTDFVRRDKVVRMIPVGGADDFPELRDEFDPERISSACQELKRLMSIVEMLPDRCRTIFRMRKIDGLSQKEIAARLGVSISIVENEAVKGLAQITRDLRAQQAGSSVKRTFKR